MIKLEEWAIEALHTVFTGPAESLTRIASEYWETGTLLRLRAFTGVTKLDTPISAFIQYFISINTKETADNDMTAARTNALTCVGLYNSLKGSENDSALLGCVFLNILSLGHRSSIRGSGLTGNDRAILYAAQIELIDISSEFCSLQWLDSPGSLGRYYLCSDCQAILARRWVGTFKNCKKELGSGSPLKDVTLVAQLPKYRWELLVDMGNKVKPLGCGKMLPDPYDLRRSGVKCTAIPLLSYIDRCIRKVYEEAASRHKKFAEELFQ
ncbi:hypothetical protein FRC11_003080 [Ceratobasidium sp. 423]|nr:hypothetical protein FRC11_003080 [Ceratobasidium sp. 423]